MVCHCHLREQTKLVQHNKNMTHKEKPMVIITNKKLKTFPELMKALKNMYLAVSLTPQQVIEIKNLQSEFDDKKEKLVLKYMRKELDLYNKYYVNGENKNS